MVRRHDAATRPPRWPICPSQRAATRRAGLGRATDGHHYWRSAVGQRAAGKNPTPNPARAATGKNWSPPNTKRAVPLRARHREAGRWCSARKVVPPYPIPGASQAESCGQYSAPSRAEPGHHHVSIERQAGQARRPALLRSATVSAGAPPPPAGAATAAAWLLPACGYQSNITARRRPDHLGHSRGMAGRPGPAWAGRGGKGRSIQKWPRRHLLPSRGSAAVSLCGAVRRCAVSES